MRPRALRLVCFALATACGCFTQASAQNAAVPETPVVFVHGLASSGATWEAAAARLQEVLAIRAYTPTVNWRDRYPDQAGSLQGQMSGLSGNVVAVGHSNGGIVARQWSLHRPLRGVVTLGSPNWGAPLVDNLLAWAYFNEGLYDNINDIISAVREGQRNGYDWSSVVAGISGALNFAGVLADPRALASATGLSLSVPVVQQMAVNSSFMRDTNSEAGRAQEAGAIGKRVSIASFSAQYYYGGPMWIINPDRAPEVADLLAFFNGEVVRAANGILGSLQIEDFWGDDVARAIGGVATWLARYNETWCRVISSPTGQVCWLSDGLVPFASQQWGERVAHWQGGPPHTRQTSESDEALTEALNIELGVPLRNGSVGEPPSGGYPTVTSGYLLYPGQLLGRLTSEDGRFTLAYQEDGNLVLYKPGDVPVWWTDTFGSAFAVFQFDGNFVIYDAAGSPMWSTGTVGTGAYLAVQNDGNVVIYSSADEAIWATGTEGVADGDSGGGGSGHTGGDACSSEDRHNHWAACGASDECGHSFGSDTDCGCSNAPIVYDTCYQRVCDSGQTWVDEYCTGSATMCDWEEYCWWNSDGFDSWQECGYYPTNCREESYDYVCGGHWETFEHNCRDEAYECNPRQC